MVSQKTIAMALEKFSVFCGGAESYAVSLAKTLVEKGWQVHFYGEQWDGIPEQAVFHKIAVPKFLPSGAKMLTFAIKHRRMIKRNNFDVISPSSGISSETCLYLFLADNKESV